MAEIYKLHLLNNSLLHRKSAYKETISLINNIILADYNITTASALRANNNIM